MVFKNEIINDHLSISAAEFAFIVGSWWRAGVHDLAGHATFWINYRPHHIMLFPFPTGARSIDDEELKFVTKKEALTTWSRAVWPRCFLLSNLWLSKRQPPVMHFSHQNSCHNRKPISPASQKTPADNRHFSKFCYQRIGVEAEVKLDDFKTLLGRLSDPNIYTLEWLTFLSLQP